MIVKITKSFLLFDTISIILNYFTKNCKKIVKFNKYVYILIKLNVL